MGLLALEGLEAAGSRAVGSSKDIRAEVGAAAGGEAEGGDHRGHLDIKWRFVYKTMIPRKLSHEMNGKSSSNRVVSEGCGDHFLNIRSPSQRFNRPNHEHSLCCQATESCRDV